MKHPIWNPFPGLSPKKAAMSSSPKSPPGSPGWALLLWVVLWQLAAAALKQSFLLASPVQVLLRLVELVREASFWSSIAFSCFRIMGGFFLGFVAAGLLCAASSRSRLFSQALQPPMAFMKAAPVASFIILCLLWIPSRNLSVFIAFLMVLPVLYTHLLQGVLQTDPGLLEMAKIFRLSSWRRLQFIYLPQIFPYLRSACHLALGLCWKAGIAAEVIGIPAGSIGENLYNAKIYLNSADLFAWTLVIIALSTALDFLFLQILDWVVLERG